MNDIVRRLERAALPDPHDEREVMHASLLREASNHIANLRAELAAAKATTQRIVLSANEAAAILGDQCEKMEQERDEARAQLAAAKARKPVAWMFQRRYGNGLTFVQPADYTDEDGNLVQATPLYTAIGSKG